MVAGIHGTSHDEHRFLHHRSTVEGAPYGLASRSQRSNIRPESVADSRCAAQMNIMYALCEWRLDEDNAVREHVRQQVRLAAVCLLFAVVLRKQARVLGLLTKTVPIAGGHLRHGRHPPASAHWRGF